jgi:hypothetical protein
MTAESQNSGRRIGAIARQQLGKHTPGATDIHVTREEILEVVFSVQSMLRLYN